MTKLNRILTLDLQCGIFDTQIPGLYGCNVCNMKDCIVYKTKHRYKSYQIVRGVYVCKICGLAKSDSLHKGV